MLNSLVNELAYNPPGPEEGYLFWNAWVACALYVAVAVMWFIPDPRIEQTLAK